ncbi:MAG TPA: hypothetical protein VKD91_19975 [Pyrinomonadaceae bacterium]|nr:hypothetical protein [Pyrinomonadaceae bacterium]
MRVFLSFFISLIVGNVLITQSEVGAPDKMSAFDEYGGLQWADEKARLDNFAIQLLEAPGAIGYILLFNAPGMCKGEAQARAVRAKKYVVEYRRVPPNHVIWREEGFVPELRTTLYIADVSAASLFATYHSFTFGTVKESFVTKGCKTRLADIRNSKWK